MERPLLSLKVLTERVTKIRAEILVLGVFQDQRPLHGLAGEVDWIHHGILSHLIQQDKFSGKIGDALLLHTHPKLPTPTTLLLGLGPRGRFDYSTLRQISEIAMSKIWHLQAKQCAMEFFGLLDCALDLPQSVDSLWEALKAGPVTQGVDVSLLVADENKARQIEQRFIAVRGTA
jgi:hypothetical protein